MNEFWGVTTYFNPAGYQNKLENLKLFANRARDQGLKLLIVEAAFNEGQFVVDAELADRIVHVRASAELWQKERLLNIGLASLPDTCDKVAWLDADILFQNDAWVRETAMLLDDFLVVQPFDVAWWLPHGVQNPRLDFSADAFALISHGLSYTQSGDSARKLSAGHWGFAWAARCDLLKTHWLYDRLIVGGGDLVVAWGIYGDEFIGDAQKWLPELCTESHFGDILRWKNAFNADVRGRCSYVPGTVFHLWHGNIADRGYLERLRILKGFQFDPSKDIEIEDRYKCWRWSSDKPQLHAWLRKYFSDRKEEMRDVQKSTPGC